MRTIFSILGITSLILLTSCFLFNSGALNAFDNHHHDIINIRNDSIYHNLSNYRENLTIRLSDTNITYSTYSTTDTSITYSDSMTSSGMGSSHVNTYRSIASTDYISVALHEENKGVVAYKIPDTMKVGQTYRIELRISKYNTPSLVEDLSLSIPNKPTVKPIRVGRTMETRLISLDDAFTIKTDNTPIQTIEMDSCYTDWVWFITPTKSGDHYLRLLIVIKEDNLVKDIPVYEGNIHVKASPGWSIWEFIKSYWQWLLGSIVIPIFAWWFVNRNKKKTKPRKKPTRRRNGTH